MSEKKIRIWTIKGAAAVLTIVFYAVLYTNLDPTMWQIAMCAVATYELIIYIIRSFMLYRREHRREIRRERCDSAEGHPGRRLELGEGNSARERQR